MKKLFIFLVFSISMISYVAASINEIKGINEENILNQQQRVATILKREKYIRVGFLCTLACAGGYVGYKLFLEPAPVQAVEAPAIIPIPNEDPWKLIQKNQELIIKQDQTIKTVLETERGYQQQLSEYGIEFTDQKMGWYAWLKSWSRYLGTQTIFIGLGQIITGTLNPVTKYINRFDEGFDRFLNKLFHTIDLNWFITHHTQYDAVSQQLKESAQQISGIQDEEASKRVQQCADAYDINLFVTTWNLYVQQVESIIGYMEHKVANLPKTMPSQTINSMRSAIDRLKNAIDAAQQTITPLITMHYEVSNIPDLMNKVEDALAKVQESHATFSIAEMVALL